MATEDPLPIPNPLKPALTYRALVKCTVIIKDSNLSPTEFGDALFAEELISDTAHKDAKDTHTNRTRRERIEDMMEHVREACKSRGQVFATFIGILHEQGERDLADTIIKKYRELEKEEQTTPTPQQTSPTSQQTSSTPQHPEKKLPSNVNVRKLTRVITDVFNNHYASLHDAITPSLESFAMNLGSKGLLSKSVRDKPSYSAIMQEFLTVFQFFREVKEFETHCSKFFKVLYSLAGGQGGFQTCTTHLVQELKDAINKELKIEFSIDYEN